MNGVRVPAGSECRVDVYGGRTIECSLRFREVGRSCGLNRSED